MLARTKKEIGADSGAVDAELWADFAAVATVAAGACAAAVMEVPAAVSLRLVYLLVLNYNIVRHELANNGKE